MNDKKIKLVQIITSLGYGGAERLLFDLVRNLDKKNYDVSVVCVVRGGPLVKEFENLGIDVKIIGKPTKLGLGAVYKIYKYLKVKKPKIVHTHLFGGDTWGRMAAILARAPVIISTEHNINLDEGFIKRVFKRFLSGLTTQIIAVSQAVKDYSVKTDRINPDKIEVIYNGVDLKKFYNPRPEFFANKIPVIGVIARLDEQKGHRYLLEALARIKDYNFEVWLVGDGSLKNKLAKQAEALSIKNKVKFFGAKDDVRPILDKIDLFVLPSLWEGLGIAVLEAGAAARPVISTKVGGVPEIISDKKTGLLVEPKDPAGLAEAIKWILENQLKAQTMALALQKEVKEKFSLEKMVKEYDSLYQSLVP